MDHTTEESVFSAKQRFLKRSKQRWRVSKVFRFVLFRGTVPGDFNWPASASFRMFFRVLFDTPVASHVLKKR